MENQATLFSEGAGGVPDSDYYPRKGYLFDKQDRRIKTLRQRIDEACTLYSDNQHVAANLVEISEKETEIFDRPLLYMGEWVTVVKRGHVQVENIFVGRT